MPPELRGSRLLLVYLAVVGLAGAIVSGPLFRPIVNYLLLAGYAAVIRWWGTIARWSCEGFAVPISIPR